MLLYKLKDIFFHVLVSKSQKSPMLQYAHRFLFVFSSVEITASAFACPLCLPYFLFVFFFFKGMLIQWLRLSLSWMRITFGDEFNLNSPHYHLLPSEGYFNALCRFTVYFSDLSLCTLCCLCRTCLFLALQWEREECFLDYEKWHPAISLLW